MSIPRKTIRPTGGKPPDPKALRMARIREEMDVQKAIIEGSKGAFWLGVRQMVARQGMIARARLDSHDTMTAEQRAIWLDRYLRYEWFISLVERAPRTLDMLEEKFAKIKAGLEGAGESAD